MPPHKFLSRSLALFSLIGFLQLVHLTVFPEFEWANIVVWSLLFSLGFSFLWLSSTLMPRSAMWPRFRVREFLLIFFLSFFFTIFFSRVPYVLAYLNVGMYEIRKMESLGGGWYSFLTVFFYPLAILLAFLDISRRLYFVCLFFVSIVVLVDLLVLGTRGGPVFVLLFHFLMARVNFIRFRTLALVIALALAFLVIFDFQTKARSLNTVTVGWDWSLTLSHSWIFDRLPLKDWVLESVSGSLSILGPVLYFLQYLTHSIAEFRALLWESEYDLSGTMLYLKDEVCLVVGCGREAIHEAIASENPSAGLYQTLYSSLLFDFGYLGAMSLFLASFMTAMWARFKEHVRGFLIYLAVIFSVSMIENYIYNGLGLARFLIFGMLWAGLSSRFLPYRGLPDGRATKIGGRSENRVC